MKDNTFNEFKDMSSIYWILGNCIQELSFSSLKLHALLGEILASFLNLSDKLMIRLIAVSQGEQVPSDVDQGISSEEDYSVEGKCQNEEDPWVVGILLEFFASTVTEEEVSQGSEPGNQNKDWFLHNLIETSHFIYYFFFIILY